MLEKIINTLKAISEDNYNRYMHPSRFGCIGAKYTPKEMEHLVRHISVAMSEMTPNLCGLETLAEFAERMEKLQNTPEAHLKNGNLEFIDVGMDIIQSILPLNEDEDESFMSDPVMLGEQYSLREYTVTRAKYCSTPV